MSTISLHDQVVSALRTIRYRGILKAILFSLPRVVDLGSDISLAILYWDTCDPWWFALTTANIVVPWLLQILVAACVPSDILQCLAPRFYQLTPLLALTGNLPFFVRLLAEACPFSARDYHALKRVLHSFLMIELFFEALPQSALQIYITGRVNRFDIQRAIAIFSSILTIALNFAKCLVRYYVLRENDRPRFATSRTREFVFMMVLTPFCYLFVAVFLFPVFLFISIWPNRANLSFYLLLLPLFLSSLQFQAFGLRFAFFDPRKGGGRFWHLPSLSATFQSRFGVVMTYAIIIVSLVSLGAWAHALQQSNLTDLSPFAKHFSTWAATAFVFIPNNKWAHADLNRYTLGKWLGNPCVEYWPFARPLARLLAFAFKRSISPPGPRCPRSPLNFKPNVLWGSLTSLCGMFVLLSWE